MKKSLEAKPEETSSKRCPFYCGNNPNKGFGFWDHVANCDKLDKMVAYSKFLWNKTCKVIDKKQEFKCDICKVNLEELNYEYHFNSALHQAKKEIHEEKRYEIHSCWFEKVPLYEVKYIGLLRGHRIP